MEPISSHQAKTATAKLWIAALCLYLPVHRNNSDSQKAAQDESCQDEILSHQVCRIRPIWLATTIRMHQHACA
jgi:hypothetical protein